jgi:hypothetical protein
MSHRSARTAAASATADVSDPPRPSVARSPSSVTPWKPGMTAMPPASNTRSSTAASIASIIAALWIGLVRTGSCQLI